MRAPLHVFSIGAVCTHLDYHGNGYAVKILEQVKEHLNSTQSDY